MRRACSQPSIQSSEQTCLLWFLTVSGSLLGCGHCLRRPSVVVSCLQERLMVERSGRTFIDSIGVKSLRAGLSMLSRSFLGTRQQQAQLGLGRGRCASCLGAGVETQPGTRTRAEDTVTLRLGQTSCATCSAACIFERPLHTPTSSPYCDLLLWHSRCVQSLSCSIHSPDLCPVLPLIEGDVSSLIHDSVRATLSLRLLHSPALAQAECHA